MISFPLLYPQTQLLSIRQHEQVTNGRNGCLSVKERLGGLLSEGVTY